MIDILTRSIYDIKHAANNIKPILSRAGMRSIGKKKNKNIHEIKCEEQIYRINGKQMFLPHLNPNKDIVTHIVSRSRLQINPHNK